MTLNSPPLTRKPSVVGECRVKQSDRVRETNFARESCEGVPASDARAGGGPFTDSIQRDDRGLFKCGDGKKALAACDSWCSGKTGSAPWYWHRRVPDPWL